MADLAINRQVVEPYEPPLFRTNSKKLGMWLFIMSDSLTFGALLFAYSYGRISNPAWPMPFGRESIMRASIMTLFLLSSSLTMVLGVAAASHGNMSRARLWLLATMALGAGFVVLHGVEWTGLIHEGMKPFSNPWASGVPQFGGTFFTLTGMHMLHVSLGVIYLGVVALRKKFLPILVVLWAIAFFATSPSSPFHYGSLVLLLAGVVAAFVLFLKPRDYDAVDVEVSGLYWHFVDLVWMFIFPLVYLMSTRIR
ncbi:MAG: cytochrome c oxidase subunit 3 [Acidobacteria bacterium]|nr:cytochrome c oxidase subunit 3 [Acidobacteriaceae bacterium]MBV9609934.1 cytochrome c oxidase subunit 3 [Acidobacteriota bacterium]